MPFNLIQGNFAQQNSVSTTAPVTFGSPTTAGNQLFGFGWIFSGAGVTVTSISDTQNGAYTFVNAIYGSNFGVALYFLPSCSGGAGNVLTVTTNTATQFQVAGYAEFSGGYKYPDGSGTNSGTGTTWNVNCATAKASDLLIGWVGTNVGNGFTFGGTKIFSFNASNDYFLAEYLTGGAAGSQSENGTISASVPWTAILAGFTNIVPSIAAGSSSRIPIWRGSGVA